MKNNKKSPMTQARRLAFGQSEPELATLLSLPMRKAFRSELDAINALSCELIGAETLDGGPGLAFDRPQSRIAMEATAQGYRENTPELYGRKSVEVDFGTGYRVHATSQPCDCDLEETDRALLATVSHAGVSSTDDDKPEALDI